MPSVNGAVSRTAATPMKSPLFQEADPYGAAPLSSPNKPHLGIKDPAFKRSDSAIDIPGIPSPPLVTITKGPSSEAGSSLYSPVAAFDVSGRKDLNTTIIYKYTIKAIDLRTGKSLENHKALLRDQVIANEAKSQNVLHSMGNMSFVSGDEWHISGSDASAVVVFTELHDAADPIFKAQKDMSGFQKSGSGPKAHWVKFIRIGFSASRPANDDLQKLRELCSNYNAGRRLFALTFDRKETTLVPAIEPANDGGLAPLSKDDVTHYIASELKRHVLKQPGLSSIALVVRGDCVFGLGTSEARGIQRLHGLRASLSLTGTPPAAQLVWKPLSQTTGGSEKTANFFKAGAVSTFLLDYFGGNLSRELNEAQLQQASTLLKGIRVNVAVKAADSPRTATIHSLGHSARRLPTCLLGTVVGEGPVERLKFPDLPCINVGTDQKPFFYPAELCYIREGQSFPGPLPVSVDVSRLQSPSAIANQPTNTHEPKNGDPFSAVKPSDFTITFVRLNNPGHASVNESAWSDFQHELGQRYQAKLAQSVLGANHFSGSIDKLREHLSHKDKCQASVKTVILIAAPASVPATELEALKTFCAVKIGAQVQVVAAAEVNRRSKRDPANRSMVMYTSQVAKRIFSRALIPGTPDEGSKLAAELAALKKRISGGRIFGINVQSLDGEYTHGSLNDSRRTHLITIVSATGKVDAVNTTTDLCNTHSDDYLVELLASVEAAFKAHVDQHAKVNSTEAVVYISGLPSMTKLRFDSLGSAISKLTPLKKDPPLKPSNFTFLTMSRETQINIPATDSFFAISPLTPAEHHETTNNVNVGHVVLAHNYRKPAGYMDTNGQLREPTTLWRALRRKAVPGGGFKTEELLMRAREPSILQLAALANKRAKGRVIKVDGKLEVAAVKEGLKGTLWYL
ncbi:putative PAZ domain superfamily protein [Septoria linicola]|nr:putative PAZ domain superfamily protein [Septoria linicola]